MERTPDAALVASQRRKLWHSITVFSQNANSFVVFFTSSIWIYRERPISPAELAIEASVKLVSRISRPALQCRVWRKRLRSVGYQPTLESENSTVISTRTSIVIPLRAMQTLLQVIASSRVNNGSDPQLLALAQLTALRLGMSRAVVR